MIKLNDKFSLDADQYQFILTELVPTAEGSKHAYSERKTYHPSLRQVADKIADTELKGVVTSDSIASLEQAIQSVCDSMHLLADKIKEQK
jgi:hypothetical protein